MAVSGRHLQGCVPGGWPMVRSQIQRLKWLAVEPSQQSLRCITLDSAVNPHHYKHLLMAVGRTSVRARLVKNPPAKKRHQVDSWGGKIPWRRDRLSTSAFLDFPSGSEGKESACNAGDLGSVPGLEWSPGGIATHSSIFTWRIPMDRGSWQATVCGVAKNQTRLNN